MDRGAVLFVDFIGKSVIEVLIDDEYRVDVLEAMRYLRYRHMPKATLLTGFATLYQSSTAPNDLLFNSTKLILRTERILLRIDHPQAREFYDTLNKLARANASKARKDGAQIPYEELHPAKKQNRAASGRDPGRSQLRTGKTLATDNAASGIRWAWVGSSPLEPPSTSLCPEGQGATPNPETLSDAGSKPKDKEGSDLQSPLRAQGADGGSQLKPMSVESSPTSQDIDKPCSLMPEVVDDDDATIIPETPPPTITAGARDLAHSQ